MSSIVDESVSSAKIIDSDSSRRREHQFLRQASLERNDLPFEDVETLDPLYKLIYFARKGDADEIANLLKKDEFINVVNNTDENDKYTPLMWAAVAGQTSAVEVLCKHPKVEINERGGWVCKF